MFPKDHHTLCAGSYRRILDVSIKWKYLQDYFFFKPSVLRARCLCARVASSRRPPRPGAGAGALPLPGGTPLPRGTRAPPLPVALGGVCRSWEQLRAEPDGRCGRSRVKQRLRRHKCSNLIKTQRSTGAGRAHSPPPGARRPPSRARRAPPPAARPGRRRRRGPARGPTPAPARRWFSPALHKPPVRRSMCAGGAERRVDVAERGGAPQPRPAASLAMYCAYPVPGVGSNSLMYYYNGKTVRAAGFVREPPGSRAGEDEFRAPGSPLRAGGARPCRSRPGGERSVKGRGPRAALCERGECVEAPSAACGSAGGGSPQPGGAP